MPIDHVVVIYLENHSFDNLYGRFPGADGLDQAGAAATQLNREGAPYDTLPRVMDSNPRLASVDDRFPQLPNGPFDIGQYVPMSERIGDLVHRFYQEQAQIDGGLMDRYVGVSDAGGLVMGNYDGSKLPLWSFAQHYTLADHFFHAAFGGSLLNHFWLACACTPTFPNAPAGIVAQLGPGGELQRDGAVSPDGFVVNNLESAANPHWPGVPQEQLVPPQTAPHIGDRLDARGLTWAWYTGGWNDALAGKRPFSSVIEPFAYFADLAEGSDARAQHLRDEADFPDALANDTLPNVAFVKPGDGDDEHPGHPGLVTADRDAANLVEAVQHSPAWPRTAVIVTYDENGGFWDHVAPPAGDRWGPGTRVPAIIISPYAKRGFVDHTTYDTTAILRFIEWRWGLEPLTDRDAKANDLTNAFDFSQTP